MQKSSDHLIAAVDEVSGEHKGYVFPQSVYGIELREPGIDEYYLLCILNSEVINEYIRRTVTGYKLLQPQLELEDIRALPIRKIDFTTQPDERKAGVCEGLKLFEEESQSAVFTRLDNFIAGCLADKADIVHDILSQLGRRMVKLIYTDTKSPDSDTTRQIISTRAAIEAIVRRLYSDESL